MAIIFEIIDKSGRKIYLTNERWKHIVAEHPEMQNKLEFIKETLINPHKIIDHSFSIDNLKYYYHHFKTTKYKYLRVIVKYLNGKGFIITSHFVNKIE